MLGDVGHLHPERTDRLQPGMTYRYRIDGSALVHPARGGEFELAFEKIDEDTVEIRVSGGRRDRVFHVTTAGDVEEDR